MIVSGLFPLRLLLVIVATLVAPVRADPFVDDLGRTVDVAVPVKRAVIFNRYNAELVRAVGGIDSIVAVDAGVLRDRAYWPELANIAIAGQGQNEPNYEAIVALSPDVVILPRNGAWEQAAQQLKPFGIPVLVLTAWDTLKHAPNTRMIGQLFNGRDRAEKLVAFHARYENLLVQRLQGVERKPVYFEEVRNLVTVTPGSGWHDMIEVAGGINIFGDININAESAARGNENSFAVNPEEIVARTPALVVKLQQGSYEPIPAEILANNWNALRHRDDIALTPAGATGDIRLINYYLAGGCSKITGALQLAKWLHPDRFADIDPEDAMREWIEVFQGLPFRSGMSWPLKH